METQIANKEILEKLNRLQIDVDIIKEKLDDDDIQLTDGEEKLLEESYENEKNNKLVSSDNIKKKLGI